MDDGRRRPPISGSLAGMALADWCDLDLAHLLVFGTRPDLDDVANANAPAEHELGGGVVVSFPDYSSARAKANDPSRHSTL